MSLSVFRVFSDIIILRTRKDAENSERSSKLNDITVLTKLLFIQIQALFLYLVPVLEPEQFRVSHSVLPQVNR